LIEENHMLAIVKNYGKTRSFPTCVGNLRIQRDGEIKTSNSKLVEEMKKFQLVDVDYVEGEPKEKPHKEIDYSAYRIQELRTVAAALGIPGSFTMTKSKLIKTIKETNNER